MEMPSRRRLVGGVAFMTLLGAIGYFGQDRVHMGGSHKTSEPKSASKSFIPTSNPVAKTEDQPVNLNSASAEDLQQLPGIGPTLSKRIVEYRDANGPFKTIEGLRNVSGIGKKLFEKISGSLSL